MQCCTAAAAATVNESGTHDVGDAGWAGDRSRYTVTLTNVYTYKVAKLFAVNGAFLARGPSLPRMR